MTGRLSMGTEPARAGVEDWEGRAVEAGYRVVPVEGLPAARLLVVPGAGTWILVPAWPAGQPGREAAVCRAICDAYVAAFGRAAALAVMRAAAGRLGGPLAAVAAAALPILAAGGELLARLACG